MKICFVIRSLPPYVIGGAQEAMHNLANGLVKLGEDVTILTKKYREAKIDISRDYRVKYLFSLPKDLLMEYSIPLSLLYRQFFTKFDLVMAVNVYPTGFSCARLRNFIQLPLVVHAIGVDIQIDDSIGYGLRLDPQIDRKVKFALLNCDAVIVCSKSMKGIVTGMDVASETVFILPNGVNLQEFERVTPYYKNSPYLLTVARLEKKKGIDVLIRAFSFLSQEYEQLELLIAGDGPERHHLESLARKVGVHHKVNFLGTVIGKDKVALYKGCEIFVCPSRHEPFGITNLEAMAAGKPVIASRIDGITEVVKDGQNGLLFEMDSSVDLADKLRTLLIEDRLKEEIVGNIAREIFKYDWRNVAKEWLTVLSNIIDSK